MLSIPDSEIGITTLQKLRLVELICPRSQSRTAAVILAKILAQALCPSLSPAAQMPGLLLSDPVGTEEREQPGAQPAWPQCCLTQDTGFQPPVGPVPYFVSGLFSPASVTANCARFPSLPSLKCPCSNFQRQAGCRSPRAPRPSCGISSMQTFNPLARSPMVPCCCPSLHPYWAPASLSPRHSFF